MCIHIVIYFNVQQKPTQHFKATVFQFKEVTFSVRSSLINLFFSHSVVSDSFDLMDYSLSGSSVYGILQARILEWVPVPSRGNLPNPGIKPGSPALQAVSLLSEPPGEMALVVKNMPANAGDVRDSGLVPGLGRPPGGEHGDSLQYSCLENPMDRVAWQAIFHRVAKS